MIACRANGSGTTSKAVRFVRFSTPPPSNEISSPSSAANPGATMTLSPRLIAFCRKMRAKLFATTTTSSPFRHEAACSREEPQPKFSPAAMTALWEPPSP